MNTTYSTARLRDPSTRSGKPRGKAWLGVGLTLIVLIGMRLLWISFFSSSEHVQIVDGQIDFRHSGIAGDAILALEGPWAFYPHTWLMGDKAKTTDTPEHGPTLLHVPDGWNTLMQPDQPSPYGYGSYRLRILTHPGDTTSYSLHVPSVRSASELYVNGRLLAQNGHPAERPEDAKPSNVPYTVTFTADESGVIDIIMQASNYDDPRRGGIVRSMRFGSEHAVKLENQLSVAMQLMTMITCLIFAVYSLIVYMIGTREVRQLYLALTLICAVFVFGEGGDKLFLTWFSIPYSLDFKLKFLALIVGSYALLQSVRPRPIGPRGQWIIRAYQAIGAALSISILLLPFRDALTAPFMYSYIAISMLLALVYIFRMTLADRANRLYMVVAAMAFLNNFAWDDIMIRIGVKAIFYPFDLLIAMIAFSCVWINRYFRMFADANTLADKLRLEDRRKDEFLANTSHELRNPLHGILNISQNVLEREKDRIGEQSVKDLEMVLTVGRRMSFMLGDFLDTMRLKERNISITPDSVSLKQLSANVISILQYLTEGKQVRLSNDIPADFPLVLADGNRLTQILFNLIHNALKYTIEGEVAVRAYVEGNRAVVVVEDTGIGMDEETLRRVFEPYEQADSGQAAAAGGFGLGLGICKQLVELHGSLLEVRSAPGRGTTFGFRLPISDAATQSAASREEVAAAAAEDTLPGAPVPADVMKPREDKVAILAVDDDRVNLHALTGMLAPESRYDIVHAYSGTEAWQLLDARKWDLIIADVTMPHMTGYALTQRVREKFDVYELPILLLTARTRPEDMEAGFLSGANDYVTKPVNAIELRARVRALTQFKKAVSDRLGLEAAWLQAQIKPHFILNTLNAVASLGEEDTNRMRMLIVEFSDYLRASFDFRNSDHIVSLEHELQLVRAYLNVEKERFQHRLNVVWETDASVPGDLQIPPLSLQPIVENAVKHGILNRTGGGTLTIRIADRAQSVAFQVEDDGAGVDDEKLRLILNGQLKHDQGIGLRNTNLRLRRLYGTGLQFERVPGTCMRVSFEVPKSAARRSGSPG